MNIRNTIGQICLLVLTLSVGLGAQRVEELDRDNDGRKETKVFYENDRIVKMVIDQNGDKKADGTVFFKNGVPSTGERDKNFDGKIDTWIQYDPTGLPIVIGSDRRKDGKPDYWIYLRNGVIFKREWDRNFDGKSDFRTVERYNRLIEKQYDDNFDGTFEKTVKAPKSGTRLDVKTTADTSPPKKPLAPPSKPAE